MRRHGRLTPLKEPSLLLASPSDVSYLRDIARGVLNEVSFGSSPSEELNLFAWEVETSCRPFDDLQPAQEQIPPPDDPLCRGVIAFFGEWIGRPLPDDFPVQLLEPLQPDRDDRPYRLVHPWRPNAAAFGGFPLTGSTFEVLAAIAAHRRARENPGMRLSPLFLRFVGPKDVISEPNVGRASWGNRRLRKWVQTEFGEDEDEEYRRRALIKQQLEQLRNFVLFLNEVLGHVTNFVADEDDFAEQLKQWLERDLGLLPAQSDKDPFKGLGFYDVQDAPVFYGRESDLREAMRGVRALWEADGSKWYWVRGVSGAGKSSFLRAGLVGHLVRRSHEREAYVHCVVRPNQLTEGTGIGGTSLRHGPLRSLFALCLSRVYEATRDPAATGMELTARLADFDRTTDADKAYWAAHVIGESLNSAGQSGSDQRSVWRLVIGLDQFEEIVDLLGDADSGTAWGSAIDFAIQLSHTRGVLILATMREDRIGPMSDLPQLSSIYRETLQHRCFLDFPGPSDLIQVIRKPFEQIPELLVANDLVSALSDGLHKFAGPKGRVRASLLPLVSLTLERLYREVAVPLIHEHRNVVPDEVTWDGEAAPPVDAKSEFERAVDADYSRAKGAVLSLERASGYLEIERAINVLAEEAVDEAKTAAGPNWEDTAIGLLLRRLIAWTGSTEQLFSLPAATWPSDDTALELARSMKKRRLIVDEEGGRIRLVHEAVIANWPLAQTWLEYERPLLVEIGPLLGFATKWRHEDLRYKALEAAAHFHLQPAARLLALWFDVLDGVPSEPDPENKALLRDFCLALIEHHGKADEFVEDTPRRSPYIQLAVSYRRLDIVRRMLAESPDAANLKRADQRTALFWSAYQGDLEMTTLLLEHGAEADTPDEKKWRPIHSASVSGSLAVVARLIEAGASLDALGAPAGFAPIHLAASNNRAELLDYFVKERHVDVDLRDEQGWTPIMRAASANHGNAVRTLIALGGDPHTTLHSGSAVDFGWTALHVAARDRASDSIDALLDAGLDIDRACINGATPLHLAARNGNIHSMRRLIARGANLEARTLNDWGSTSDVQRTLQNRKDSAPIAANSKFDFVPLHLAVAEGKAEAVALLLDAAADVNARTGAGATPLHVAATNNRHELVKLLVERGANTELRDANKRTPFHEALERRAFNTARALLQSGARGEAALHGTGRLSVGDEDARIAPLHKAAADDDDDVLRFLLRQKIDVSTSDYRGWTALHYAAAAGKVRHVLSLLRRGVRPDATDASGLTALHLACRKGADAVVKALLAHHRSDWGADTGRVTPLHLAAQSGSVTSVGELLDADHPIDPRDTQGWTPLHCGAHVGDEACVAALLAAGADPYLPAGDSGIGVLQLAARSGHVGCIRCLLRVSGISPDHSFGDEPVPVVLAMRYRQFDAVVALLEAGASIETADPTTGLPLAEAYERQVTRALGLGALDPRNAALERLLEARGFAIAQPGRPSQNERAEPAPTTHPRVSAWRSSATPPQPGATAFCPDLSPPAESVWTRVLGQELEGFIQQMSPVDGKHRLKSEDAEVHWRTLPWYESVTLIHVSTPELAVKKIRIFYLKDAGNFYRLNGTSPPIHQVNAKAPIALSERNVLDYLRFFCFFVRGEEGPFYVSETLDDPLLPRNTDEITRSVVEGTIRPASFYGISEQGHYLCDAVVFYSNAIFIANFVVHPTGMLEMLDDEPIAAELPCRVDAPLG